MTARSALGIAALVVVLVVAAFTLGRNTAPAYEGQLAPTEVPAKAIAQREPDTKIGKLERIVRPPVKPRAHNVARGAAIEVVRSFVTYSQLHELRGAGDSLAMPARDSAIGRAPYAPFSFTYRPGKLELFPYDAAGDKHQITYNVHDPRVAVRDTTILVQGSRFYWVDDVAKAGGIAAVAYGAGAKEPAVMLSGIVIYGAGVLLGK